MEYRKEIEGINVLLDYFKVMIKDKIYDSQYMKKSHFTQNTHLKNKIFSRQMAAVFMTS